MSSTLPVVILITNCDAWKVNLIDVFDFDVYVSFVLEINRHSLSNLSHKQCDGDRNNYTPYYSKKMKMVKENTVITTIYLYDCIVCSHSRTD